MDEMNSKKFLFVHFVYIAAKIFLVRSGHWEKFQKSFSKKCHQIPRNF